jgi:signal peptidase II
MSPRKRIALVVFTLIACVGCDQKTKSLAGHALQGHDARSFLGGIIRLDYTENPGGFLSLGDSLPAPWRTAVFNIGCTAGVVVALSFALLASKYEWLQLLGLSLVCAGGIGNLIDRWAFGYARDFLNVGLGPVRTGIFNVADVVLMAGCLILLIQLSRHGAESEMRA